ncbi:MAG: hypothetical protein WC814_01265 [Candidatus Paceibacterota bacterium]|jgi:hypothetical protein
MRISVIAISTFFMLASTAFAGTQAAGEICNYSSDCISGLSCGGSGTCQATQTTGINTSGTQVTGVNTSGQNVTLINPLKGGASIESFLRSILAFVVRIGSIIVILMLVLVGYKFVTAQGEPGKISEARQMLLWTVVGALILLGAQAIATGIEATMQALSTGR